MAVRGLQDKGNRNEIEGKQFIGARDIFIADGGQRRFEPLWWRTWRYLQLSIETQDQALTIDDLHGVYTGYPFERKARFDAGSPEIQKILDTGWRTARLCAHETYMDCPYYEQLQYAGDTRVQALVSLYMTGDGRLMRNAIELLDSSRSAEGATYSRAPSRLQQYIPPFSLWWIGMLHDYWMYQDDPAFVARMLPGVRAVLSFFAAHQRPAARWATCPGGISWIGPRSGRRRAAGRRRGQFRAARSAITAGLPVGRGDGSRLGQPRAGGGGPPGRRAPARFRARALLGRRPQSVRGYAREGVSASTRSRPMRWPCWRA